MKKITTALFLLPLSFLAIACSSNAPLPPELLQTPGQTMSSEYRIGVDDQIQITVWGNEALSVNMPVRPDGQVSMPLIGDVQAGGLTSEEMSSQISARLADYMRNPNVTVQITELRSHEYLSRVRITGAVQTQVSIPYRQGMTVLDLVLAAGGVTEFAAPNRATLHRNTGAGTQSYEINLDRLLNKGDVASNVQLVPGDTITVPRRAF
jgi:polysaccharide export outer membrane protein